MMMKIASNYCARKGGKEREEIEEGNIATQSAPCVKGLKGDWAREV